MAGLNHGLHRIAENNRIRSALSNPNGVPEANIDAVNEIKSEVYELFTSDMKKYENSAVVNIDLETNSSFAGSTSGGIINSKTGKFSGKIGVTFYKQAFQTNYSLAKAILHEFYHVADFASGFVTKSYLNYKKRFDTKTSINKIRALNEVRAYKYIYNLGDNTSVFSPEIRKKYGL